MTTQTLPDANGSPTPPSPAETTEPAGGDTEPTDAGPGTPAPTPAPPVNPTWSAQEVWDGTTGAWISGTFVEGGWYGNWQQTTTDAASPTDNGGASPTDNGSPSPDGTGSPAPTGPPAPTGTADGTGAPPAGNTTIPTGTAILPTLPNATSPITGLPTASPSPSPPPSPSPQPGSAARSQRDVESAHVIVLSGAFLLAVTLL